MRRMIAFLLCGFMLFLLKGGKLPTLSIFDKAQRVVLVLDEENHNYKNAVQNGNDFYYSFEGESMREVLENLNEMQTLKGVNLYFSKDLPLSYFQERLDYLGEKSTVEEMDIYYGFFKNYHKFELVNAKKVNVQLVFGEDGWVMGLPLILTGF